MNLDIGKIIPIGVGITGIWLVGVALGYIPKLSVGPLIAALVLVALVAFFGAMRFGASLRLSATAALIITYFAFFASLATSERGRAKIEAEVGQQLWSNFTYLVGGVILFYFGVSAVNEITRHVRAAAGSQPAPARANTAADDQAG